MDTVMAMVMAMVTATDMVFMEMLTTKRTTSLCGNELKTS